MPIVGRRIDVGGALGSHRRRIWKGVKSKNAKAEGELEGQRSKMGIIIEDA